MGQHTERMGRLQANRMNVIGSLQRAILVTRSTSVDAAVNAAATDVTKASKFEGFEGNLGDEITAKLKEIRAEITRFQEYQVKLAKAIQEAQGAMDDTASSGSALPKAALNPAQQNTVSVATQTDSPVQVRPGVTMSPAQAQQYYLDQAEAEREEKARQLNEALDAKIAAIIDDLPTSKYDEDKKKDDPLDDGPLVDPGPLSNPGGNGGGGYTPPQVDNGGGTKTPHVDGGGLDDGGGKGNDNGGVDDGGGNEHVMRPPHVYPPVNPPVNPPWEPPVDPTSPPREPNLDGGTGGEIPGGTPPGTSVTPPGGGGVTASNGGVSGSVAGVGGAAGAVAGGLGAAGRLSAARLAGGLGGGVNGAGLAGGAGAGANAVVAPGAAAGRGGVGMMGGGAAAGGQAGGKRRRRGQNLEAFSLDADDEETSVDLGAAGAAGSATSEGREDTSW